MFRETCDRITAEREHWSGSILGIPPCTSIVFVLRCTQKLLDRLNATPDSEPAPADTVLGDWYANLIRVVRIQVVLAVSERSLLPIVVPARDSRALFQWLSEALSPMLTAVDVPTADATAERGAMQHWAVGSRQTTASLDRLTT